MQTILIYSGDELLSTFKTLSFVDKNSEPINIGSYNDITLVDDKKIINTKYISDDEVEVDGKTIKLSDLNVGTFTFELNSSEECSVQSVNFVMFNGVTVSSKPKNVKCKLAEVGVSQKWQDSSLILSPSKNSKKHRWNIAISVSPEISGDVGLFGIYFGVQYY